MDKDSLGGFIETMTLVSQELPPQKKNSVHMLTTRTEKTFYNEVISAIKSLLPHSTKKQEEFAWGEVRSILRSLETDRLPGRLTIKEVVSQPSIRELRLANRRFNRLRIYMGTPQLPPDYVLLLCHIKEVDGLSDKAIRHKQNQHMSTAQGRYNLGIESRWGHIDSSCPSCLSTQGKI